MPVYESLEARRVVVTGATGFLGHHVVKALLRVGADVVGVSTADVDLQDREATLRLLTRETTRHSYVVHLAYPGSRHGIETSVKTPFTLAADLVQMDLHVIRACAQLGVAKLLCLGSVCAYPEHTPIPTHESHLWDGYPEPVNAAYGLAKRNQLMLLHAARQEHNLHGIHLIAANMYGPGDRSGHVIPALITRMRQAQKAKTPLVVWGSPEVTRSFLYVEDAAEGIVRALATYDSPEPMNLVRSEETSMEGLVQRLAKRLRFTGPVTYDPTKPTGHLRRCFDTTRLRAVLQWLPSTPFTVGLDKTLDWHLAHIPMEPTR